jgi:hypothetical protein
MKDDVHRPGDRYWIAQLRTSKHEYVISNLGRALVRYTHGTDVSEAARSTSKTRRRIYRVVEVSLNSGFFRRAGDERAVPI